MQTKAAPIREGVIVIKQETTMQELQQFAAVCKERFGDIKELNGAVHFLCSEAASFVTGAMLPIWFFQGIEKMKYIAIVNLSARLLFVVAIFLFIHNNFIGQH